MDLRVSDVDSGLVTVTVPGAPSYMMSTLRETVTDAPLPLTETDLDLTPERSKVTVPLR